MPSSQRPFSFFSMIAAWRQQTPTLTATPQPNKHTHPHAATQPSSSSTSYSSSPSSSQARSISSSSPSHPQTSAQTTSSPPPPPQPSRTTGGGGMMGQFSPLHSPRPISGGSPAHRRGSDSSSEGFRDVLGADKWYIGGRTAAGEEKFFKLGVVKRVRSQDRLSLDRLSL
ncbi:hypothetical protein GQX73_g10721 [Xylaria multiplex]|uniref:Uncharacterized protein n=1 Tax=Xylaria multiplex TaxID=323545 RepID=A0A7C8MJD5_9PEZI|nr:hypothetical protein GQX73_g10721 [Xylaria multiplex]